MNTTQAATVCLKQLGISSYEISGKTWLEGGWNSLDPLPLRTAIENCLGITLDDSGAQNRAERISSEGSEVPPAGVMCTTWTTEFMKSEHFDKLKQIDGR